MGQGSWTRSGDGTVPYMSLSHSLTWLLDEGSDAADLGDVSFSVKVEGDDRWRSRRERDEGEAAGAEPPEPTCDKRVFERDVAKAKLCFLVNSKIKSKISMEKFESVVTRDDGKVFRTVVIEAVGIEHKAITRDEEVLETVLSEVFKRLQ